MSCLSLRPTRCYDTHIPCKNQISPSRHHLCPQNHLIIFSLQLMNTYASGPSRPSIFCYKRLCHSPGLFFCNPGIFVLLFDIHSCFHWGTNRHLECTLHMSLCCLLCFRLSYVRMNTRFPYVTHLLFKEGLIFVDLDMY